jgi:hypothetical protein
MGPTAIERRSYVRAVRPHYRRPRSGTCQVGGLGSDVGPGATATRAEGVTTARAVRGATGSPAPATLSLKSKTSERVVAGFERLAYVILDLKSPTTPRVARIWLGEVPELARSQSPGTVSTHWRLQEGASEAATRRAAWGFKVGLGGRGLCGLLGAEFTPHHYERLEVRVDVLEQVKARPDPVLSAAKTGLPHEYVGGVLAGALHEPTLLGAGILRFRWAAPRGRQLLGGVPVARGGRRPTPQPAAGGDRSSWGLAAVLRRGSAGVAR